MAATSRTMANCDTDYDNECMTPTTLTATMIQCIVLITVHDDGEVMPGSNYDAIEWGAW